MVEVEKKKVLKERNIFPEISFLVFQFFLKILQIRKIFFSSITVKLKPQKISQLKLKNYFTNSMTKKFIIWKPKNDKSQNLRD